MKIIDFTAAKRERSPHWEGRVICMDCRHEWQGVGPVGKHVAIDCPECALPKGVTKWLHGAQVGDVEFRCICGCEALTAYYRAGRFTLCCMACGTNQTAAIFGEAV